MLGSTVDLLDIGSIITLEIHQPWTEYDCHASRSSASASALTIVIIAPAIDVSTSAKKQGVDVTAFDCHRTLFKQDFDQNGRELLGRVWIIYSELAGSVRAHRVDQIGSCYEDRVALPTSNLSNRNIVAAESRHRMHLLSLRQPLSETQLSSLIVSPREYFSKFFGVAFTWFPWFFWDSRPIGDRLIRNSALIKLVLWLIRRIIRRFGMRRLLLHRQRRTSRDIAKRWRWSFLIVGHISLWWSSCF